MRFTLEPLTFDPLRRWVGAAALALGPALLASSCSSKTTQAGGLEVILSTDLKTPDVFDTVRLEIAQEVMLGQFHTWVANDYRVPAETTLPTTVSIAAGSLANQGALIRVTARKGTTPVVLRQVQLQIPKDRVAELTLVISVMCVGRLTVDANGNAQTECPDPTQSCQPDTGGCGPTQISAAQLPTYTPGSGALDGGPLVLLVPDGGAGGMDSDASASSSGSASGSGSSSGSASGSGSGSASGSGAGSDGGGGSSGSTEAGAGSVVAVPCPSAPPMPGPCSSEGLACRYPNMTCTCTSSEWSCSACPAAQPSTSGGVCGSVPFACQYGIVTCACYDPNGFPWTCGVCPSTKPTGGTLCGNTPIHCDYGNTSCTCSGSGASWSCNTSTCPPAPPSRWSGSCSYAPLTCQYADQICNCRTIGGMPQWVCACPATEPANGTICPSGASCVYQAMTCNCPGGGWSCVSSCPSAEPASGTSCMGTLSCSYAGRFCSCQNGTWTCQ